MEKLLEIINKFPERRVGVIGDLILDRYLFCEVERISPEAPVPVAKVLDEKYVLGGAANVAANVRSLGGKASILGVAGKDSRAALLRELFSRQGIDFEIALEEGRPTTAKTRLLAQGQQMARIDREDSKDIQSETEARIIASLPPFLEKVEILILSDYAKGVVTSSLAKKIIEMAGERKIKVLVDPVPETFEKFRDAYLIKPNKKEAEALAGAKFENDYSNLSEVLRILQAKFNSNLVVTLGKDGMAVLEEEGIYRVETAAQSVYDVSGAGDTVMAGLALGIAAGADLKTAALISNFSAGVAVAKLGTATVSSAELKEALRVK